MATKPSLLHFLVRLEEGSSGPVYVARCKEYDFGVHGNDLEDLKKRLKCHIQNQVALAKHLGYEPFENFKPKNAA